MSDTQKSSGMEGVTVLHVIFAVVIFGLLFTGFAGFVQGSARFHARQNQRAVVSRRGVESMELLRDLVRGADGESFIADPFGTTKLPDGSVREIQLRRVVGVDAELSVALSEVIRVCWRPARGESVDGFDNNGNNIVDEGELVLVRPNGLEQLIARGVPQQGLRFKDTGDGFVSLSLTIVNESVAGDEQPISRVFETRVALR